MMISDVKYTKQFNFHGIDEWIGIKVSLNEGDDEMEALRLAKTTAVKFFNEGVSEYNEVKAIMATPLKPEELDVEFEKVKDHLQTIEFREDAQAYIETTEYHLTIEAKKIINAKPLKTK